MSRGLLLWDRSLLHWLTANIDPLFDFILWPIARIVFNDDADTNDLIKQLVRIADHWLTNGVSNPA